MCVCVSLIFVGVQLLYNVVPVLLYSKVNQLYVQMLCYAQSCPTVCYPMDCGPPDSSVLGIFQARIMK